jgi:hypothetical protein
MVTTGKPHVSGWLAGEAAPVLFAELLQRVMKNDSCGVPLPGPDPADSMPHFDAINAACSLHRTVVHGKHGTIPLPQRQNLHARLHAGALFRQDELSTRKIPPWFSQ